ncbi:hypothetical protein JTE90_008951 [Oedothorax gibbosus]|uniref:Mitochondrial transcription rescue factor 1 C-terminal domain-containing protein n=1 Tax=Oedothorax gibbosus TaxID=931172 RepID=A0AAV6UVU3_9ARAC|nr:hypothetical protein JTE90_008951 [Oedothorax gibbosus]
MNYLVTRLSSSAKYLIRLRHGAISPLVTSKQIESYVHPSTMSYYRPSTCLLNKSICSSVNKSLLLQPCSLYSKKKKQSKIKEEVEESDDEDAEEMEETNEIIDDYNLVIKSVASLRIDSVLKAALGTSRKKIEKDFYSTKIRINGETALKKAAVVRVDDELDLIKSSHPENNKMLLVDRIVIKSIGRVNDNGNFPIKMQVFKSLAIENYSDPYMKSSLSEAD